jgi:hypothetical protein
MSVSGQWRSMCSSYLSTDLFLIFSWEVDEVIVLCSDQEGYSGLVEAATLSVPLFDTVQRRLPRQVEHEENRYRIIADQWQHIDELPLPTQIPYRESDLSVPNRYSLLHEVDACDESSATCQSLEAFPTYQASGYSPRPSFPQRT